MPLQNIIKIFQTIKKSLSAQEFGLEIYSMEIQDKVQSKNWPSCMWHSYFTGYMSLPYIINLPQTVWELWPSQDFCFRGDNYITKWELSVLYSTPPLVLIFIPTNIIKLSQTVWEIWPAQDFAFRRDNYIMKKARDNYHVSESCFSCMPHAYWSFSSFLLNIIKICLRVSKLWSAQGCV